MQPIHMKINIFPHNLAAAKQFKLLSRQKQGQKCKIKLNKHYISIAASAHCMCCTFIASQPLVCRIQLAAHLQIHDYCLLKYPYLVP